MESLADILKRVPVQVTTEPDGPLEPACPICEGAGYLRYDVPADDPRFGEPIVCECTRPLLEQQQLARLIERSNLADLQHLSFETFILKYRDGAPPARSPDAAFQLAMNFAREPSGWLVVYGAFGTGKTHLAAAIANYRVARGKSAVFVVVPDLLDHLRSTFSPNSEVSYDDQFETVRNTPLLILDDLGTQSSSPWAQEKLYQIINHRYNRGLPTVITTNLAPDDIEPRLRSRLADNQLSKLCEIRNRDVRLGIEYKEPSPHRKTVRRVREERP
ncbi:MAG: ATP-binding protein [Chloroflexota bacterium]